jgi:quercetin dioxygenase-like cupin family protein
VKVRNFVAVAPILALMALQAHAAEGPAVKTDILLQADHAWNGSLYQSYPQGQPELTLVRIKIPPHTALPWHTHAAPNAAYVVSGTLRLEIRGSNQVKLLHAGDTLPETVGTVHRGLSGDQPVELLVFYAGAKGLPLASLAP